VHADRTRGSAGEVLIWFPRVILLPLYAVHEYLVRRPLSALVPYLEREDIPTKVYNFFVFGRDHKAGVVPTGFVEFNFHPSAGLYAFWDDGPVAGNEMILHAEAGSTEWLFGSFTDRIRISGEQTIQLQVRGVRRPDYLFYGLGPTATDSHRSRYGADRIEGTVTVGSRLWRQSRVDAGMGVRDVRTYDGHFGGDPSTSVEASRGAFALPYGFGTEYTVGFSRAALAIDSRHRWPLSGSGVRLEVEAEEDGAWRPGPGASWVRYGGTLGGFLDVNGRHRVLSASVAVLFVDPLTGPVPFTELVSLGGDGPMRGFYPRRLVDRSAAAATLRYVWPVGPWLSASLQLATGNVFGEHLQEFRWGLLRLSGAIGLVAQVSTDSPIELLLGAGTETFDDKAHLNTVRFAFGINHF
jgi:hypothetical protein